MTTTKEIITSSRNVPEKKVVTLTLGKGKQDGTVRIMLKHKRARAVDAALYYGLSEGEYNYDVRVPAEVFTIGSGTSLFDIDFEDFRMALAFLQRNWHPSDHVEIAQNSEQNHDQEDEDEEDDEE